MERSSRDARAGARPHGGGYALIDTRMIFVEGLPARGEPDRDASLLAHRIKRQLELNGVESHWYHVGSRAHPLHRSYDPQRFGSLDEYALALTVQWQNFAARTEAEPGVWLFDTALLQPGPSSLLAAGLREDRVDAVATELLDTVAPLKPVLLYLWREAPASVDSDWTALRDWADALFAHRHERRLLLNASRVGADEALADVLGFLGVPRRESPLPEALEAALRGSYRAAEGERRRRVEVTTFRADPQEAPLAISGLPGFAASENVPLLPVSERELWLAGSRLRIHPQRDREGRVLGFMLASADPHDEIGQSFFTRVDAGGTAP